MILIDESLSLEKNGRRVFSRSYMDYFLARLLDIVQDSRNMAEVLKL